MKLYVSDNVTGYREANDEEVLSSATSLVKDMLKPGMQFDGVKTAKALLPALLAGKDYEVFCVAFLDPQHKLIAFEEMFRGTTTKVAAYPKEVMKRAMQLNAENILLVHNHPTGTAEASDADIMMTIKMKTAGSTLDINVLDHFIVSRDGVASMGEAGELNPGKVLKIMLEDLAELVGAKMVVSHEEITSEHPIAKMFKKMTH
jgi:DNA repair protein RadC